MGRFLAYSKEDKKGRTPIDFASGTVRKILEGKKSELQSFKEKVVQLIKKDEPEQFFKFLEENSGYFHFDRPFKFHVNGKKVYLPLVHLIYFLAPHSYILKEMLTDTSKSMVKNEQGETVFHLMAKGGEKLPEIGNQITNKDNQGLSILHYYAVTAQTEELQKALVTCNNVNVQDNRGQTPLFYAIHNGKIDNIKVLLKSGADVNHKSKEGCSPLLVAIVRKSENMILLLLRNNADVNQRILSTSTTPLIFAASQGFFDIAKLLVHHGADVNKINRVGVSPIHLAATIDTSFVKFLNNAGASLKSENYFGHNIGHFAAQSKDLAMLNYLKEREISFQHPSGMIKTTPHIPALYREEGMAPIHFAASTGNTEMAKKLAEDGCSMEVQTKTNQYNPLHYAAESGNIATLQFFLEITKNPIQGIIVAVKRDSVEQLRLLCENFSIDTPLDSEGRTALHFACTFCSLRAFTFLLRQGAGPYVKTHKGESPFYYAVIHGQLTQANYLAKEYTIDIHEKMEQGKTYLHLASEKGNQPIASLLIEKGAKVDEVDERGWTPLHYAAKKGDTPTVSLLLAHGADPHKIVEGQKAIDLLPKNAKKLREIITQRQSERQINHLSS